MIDCIYFTDISKYIKIVNFFRTGPSEFDRCSVGKLNLQSLFNYSHLVVLEEANVRSRGPETPTLL
jgi:hypothetical protein